MEQKRVLFNLTNQCNLKCWHCYNFSSPHQTKPLFSHLITISEKIVEMHPEYISISGGEPLTLGKNLYLILDVLKQSNAKLILMTNGTLITENTIPFLVEYFDYIQISVDNPNDYEYSKNVKGNSKYGEMLCLAIKKLEKTQIPVIYSHVPNIYNYLLSEYFDYIFIPNIRGLVSQFVAEEGRAKENCGLDLTDLQRKTYIEQLGKISKEYNIPIKLFIPKSLESDTITIDYRGNVFNTPFSGGSNQDPIYNLLM